MADGLVPASEDREKSAVAWAGSRPLLGVQPLAAQRELAAGRRSQGTKAGQAASAPAHRTQLGCLDERVASTPSSALRWDGPATSTWPRESARSQTSMNGCARGLRRVRWKEWKRPRTRQRNLRALGVPEQKVREWAGSRKGCWRIAGSAPLQRAPPNTYWVRHGVVGFTDNYRRRRAC
jgi:hypothetical protein